MQVVHFDTEVHRPGSAWVRGVNAYLHDAVAVRWAHMVDDDFHARFSAVSRGYQYILLNQATKPALEHGRVGWYHRTLDITLMQEASRYLLGEHDFSAFRASECQAKSPVRTMHTAHVFKRDAYLVFEFAANAFLQHQVRNMVGALIYVGASKIKPEMLRDLLLQKDRTQSPPTFSPDGLYLSRVDYDVKWRLPSTCRSVALL
jgi:tRNA pseudouridine38-40 synthase